MERHSELTNFIWSIADLLRHDYKPSEYGRIILPLEVVIEGTYLPPMRQLRPVTRSRRCRSAVSAQRIRRRLTSRRTENRQAPLAAGIGQAQGHRVPADLALCSAL